LVVGEEPALPQALERGDVISFGGLAPWRSPQIGAAVDTEDDADGDHDLVASSSPDG
jgi:hypothetical protein